MEELACFRPCGLFVHLLQNNNNTTGITIARGKLYSLMFVVENNLGVIDSNSYRILILVLRYKHYGGKITLIITSDYIYMY